MASSLTTLQLKLICNILVSQWALLQPSEENTKEIKDACRSLEMTVMQIFINYGWRFRNRLE
jgi:hypothetical protein